MRKVNTIAYMAIFMKQIYIYTYIYFTNVNTYEAKQVYVAIEHKENMGR